MSNAPATEHVRTIEVEGTPIRYRESGSGRATAVLYAVDGLSGISTMGRLMAARHRVIAFEMPGFEADRSNVPASSARAMAAFFAKACAVLGLQRVCAVGTSITCRIALWHAIDHPEQVDALVLLAPNAITPAVVPDTSPEKMPSVVKRDPETTARYRAASARNGLLARDQDLEDRMGGLRTPALALFGTEDRTFSIALAPLYSARMPACRHVMIEGAGHDAATDRPEETLALIDAFLEHRT